MKKSIFVLILILCLTLSVSGCRKRTKDKKESKTTLATREIESRTKSGSLNSSEVSEEEFNNALKVLSSNDCNVTSNYVIDSQMLYLEMLDKQDGYKNESSVSAYNVLRGTPDEISMQTGGGITFPEGSTDEEKEAMLLEIVKDAYNHQEVDKYTYDEETGVFEIFTKIPFISNDKSYLDYNTGNPNLVYRYVLNTEWGVYNKRLVFVSEESSIIDSMGLGDLNIAYNNVTYNKDTKKYELDLEALNSLIEDDESEITSATISFLNKKISNITIIGEDEGGKTSIVMNFTDYGTTVVDFPTNVIHCAHVDCDSYIEYNEDYHYYLCEDCRSVVNYHEHEFVDGIICKECGFIKTSGKENKELGVEIRYVNDEDETIVGVDYYDNYEYDHYDDVNGCFVYYSENLGLYFIESYNDDYTYVDYDADNCIQTRVNSTYKFYNSEELEEENLVGTITRNEFEVSHDFIDTEEHDTCHDYSVHTCDNCGLVMKEITGNHNFVENTTVQYGCYKFKEYICSDCNIIQDDLDSEDHSYVLEKIEHPLYDQYVTEMTYKCEVCGKKYIEQYEMVVEGDPDYDNEYFHTLNIEIDGMYHIVQGPHELDDNGVCIYCGRNDVLDSDSVEYFLTSPEEYFGEYICILADDEQTIIERSFLDDGEKTDEIGTYERYVLNYEDNPYEYHLYQNVTIDGTLYSKYVVVLNNVDDTVYYEGGRKAK